MQYEVYVQLANGSGKIVLMRGPDAAAATALVSALITAGTGQSFGIGVSLTPAPTPPA